MNGQTVYFDEDHHPIINENETKAEGTLFAPEEYSLWTQEVSRVNKEISENKTAQQKTASPPAHKTPVRRTRTPRKSNFSISERAVALRFYGRSRANEPHSP
jgi:hypothetical protein